LSTQFRAGGLFGFGMGVMTGFALSESRNPNIDSLALIPVLLFGAGFMPAGMMLAKKDESQPPLIRSSHRICNISHINEFCQLAAHFLADDALNFGAISFTHLHSPWPGFSVACASAPPAGRPDRPLSTTAARMRPRKCPGDISISSRNRRAIGEG
jgi:hypothetical protein